MNYSNRYFIINSWLLNSNIIIFGWHILIAKCLTFSILSQCNSNRTKLSQATHNNKVGSWNYQPLLLLNGIFFFRSKCQIFTLWTISMMFFFFTHADQKVFTRHMHLWFQYSGTMLWPIYRRLLCALSCTWLVCCADDWFDQNWYNILESRLIGCLVAWLWHNEKIERTNDEKNQRRKEWDGSSGGEGAYWGGREVVTLNVKPSLWYFSYRNDFPGNIDAVKHWKCCFLRPTI